MNDFRPWLRPTLYGPFVTTWSVITLLAMGQGLALVLPNGERLDGWLAMLFSASFFASMVVVGLLAADLALLRGKLRRLPTSGRAWTSSLLAPLGVWMLWATFGWGDEDSAVATVLFLIGSPFFAAPLALRWLLGERP